MEAMTPSEEVINGSSQTIADPLVFEPDTLALSNPRQPFCLFHCVPSPDFEDSVFLKLKAEADWRAYRSSMAAFGYCHSPRLWVRRMIVVLKLACDITGRSWAVARLVKSDMHSSPLTG
ncbi:hypothetical protein B0A52_04069 [Exophiala mesophila]|uniref:Uncharacterized protein n=1 Tax=Exophiala mesophila TaxID=212818 RepID=A0A438NA74_EXOME|nr:hypothetical protein B0A52_04069 [Exophiala mesophila]